MISSPSASRGAPDTAAAWSAIAVESTKTVRSRPASGAGADAGGATLPGVQAGTAMVPPEPGGGAGDAGRAGVSQVVASGAAGVAGLARAGTSRGSAAPNRPGATT